MHFILVGVVVLFVRSTPPKIAPRGWKFKSIRVKKESGSTRCGDRRRAQPRHTGMRHSSTWSSALASASDSEWAQSFIPAEGLSCKTKGDRGPPARGARGGVARRLRRAEPPALLISGRHIVARLPYPPLKGEAGRGTGIPPVTNHPPARLQCAVVAASAWLCTWGRTRGHPGAGKGTRLLGEQPFVSSRKEAAAALSRAARTQKPVRWRWEGGREREKSSLEDATVDGLPSQTLHPSADVRTPGLNGDKGPVPPILHRE